MYEWTVSCSHLYCPIVGGGQFRVFCRILPENIQSGDVAVPCKHVLCIAIGVFKVSAAKLAMVDVLTRFTSTLTILLVPISSKFGREGLLTR